MSDLDAFQKALAAEHAAVYGYGVVGAHLRGRELSLARTYYKAHLGQRDRLAAMIIAMGGTPVAAEAAYALPTPVVDERSARDLALVLEDGVSAVYADAVAQSMYPVRDFAARSLYATSARALAWRGAPLAFPGLPERA